MTRTKVSSHRWRQLRQEVLERDGWYCRVTLPGCEGQATEVDHIIPRSAGGPDTLDNLRAACRPCNRGRNNNPRPSREW